MWYALAAFGAFCVFIAWAMLTAGARADQDLHDANPYPRFEPGE